MNQERFDELTKELAAGTISRGEALKMLGAALVGASLASVPGAAWAAKNCKPLGSKCKSNTQCCSRSCVRKPRGRGSICGCPTGQTLCPGNNSCVQNCPPGQSLNPTTCRCTQCQNASECPTPDNECQRATCTNGLCGVENVPDGTSCDDLNACTTNDVCTAGVCAGTLRESCVRCQADADCAGIPVDQCHRAVCGAQGFCVVENLPDGTSCDDGDPCTEGDVCTAGVCAGAQIGDCLRCQNDGDCSGMGVDNPCREAVCTQAGVCAIQDKADGTPCDDANACTENDVCIAGVCGRCVTIDNSNPEAPPSPCEDPCTGQILSEQAHQDPDYSTLANFLTTGGFAADGSPLPVLVKEDGVLVRSLLGTPYSNPTRTNEVANLYYDVEVSGDVIVFAPVQDKQDGTLLYLLVVDQEGFVQKVDLPEDSQQSSRPNAVSAAADPPPCEPNAVLPGADPRPCNSACLHDCLEKAKNANVVCKLSAEAACGLLGPVVCGILQGICTAANAANVLQCSSVYGCGPLNLSFCSNDVCCKPNGTGCGGICCSDNCQKCENGSCVSKCSFGHQCCSFSATWGSTICCNACETCFQDPTDSTRHFCKTIENPKPCGDACCGSCQKCDGSTGTCRNCNFNCEICDTSGNCVPKGQCGAVDDPFQGTTCSGPCPEAGQVCIQFNRTPVQHMCCDPTAICRNSITGQPVGCCGSGQVCDRNGVCCCSTEQACPHPQGGVNCCAPGADCLGDGICTAYVNC